MNNVIRFLSAVFVAIALFNPAMAKSRHSGGSRQSSERKVQTQSAGRSPQSNKGSATTDNNKKKQQSSGTNVNQSGRSGRQPAQSNRQPNKQNGINNGNNNNNRQPANNDSRPGAGNQQRPDNGSQMRPGNGQGQQGRPGQGVQQPAQRPGQQPAQRPGQQPNNRPGASVGAPPRPAPAPQPPLSRPPMPPTYRPHQILMNPYARPVPPPAWRPRPGGPSLSTILGIALGTAIDASLNYLFRNGYSVNGYNSDVVYLRNVNQLNYVWPEAALYYNGYGLAGSRFMYSTPYYNLNRYQTVYADLVRLYGPPAQSFSRNGGYAAIWFGIGNDYVQLQFEPQYINGIQSYLTTLSFGN